MRALAFIALAACSYPALPKLGGDDASGGDDGRGDGTTTDAAPVTSCTPPRMTCGPNADQSCCDSKLVPAGSFYRGYDAASPDQTYKDLTHHATVPAFHLDTYLVTVGRFRAAVAAGALYQAGAPADNAGAHSTIAGSGWLTTWNTELEPDKQNLDTHMFNCSSNFSTWTPTSGANEDVPINCVTWYEAFAFCIWDGGYLPTEVELHYAQSGGDEQRVYPSSVPPETITSPPCSVVHYNACTPVKPNRPGSESPAGDGKWGQADLAGNMGVWVADWYNSNVGGYPTPCDNNCEDFTSQTMRMARSGGFNNAVDSMRSAYRRSAVGTTRDYLTGFRCARP